MAQDIIDFFIENPEKHAQSSVCGDGLTQLEKMDNIPDDLCGTTLCIAGSAVYLNEGLEGLKKLVRAEYTGWDTKAAELLGLNPYESHLLFYTMDNQRAFDATNAIANGDAEKFQDILNIS